MKLPNWLLITWWGIALIGILLFLTARLPDLQAGGATFADVVVFLVLIGLWVLPLVSEVNVLESLFVTSMQKAKIMCAV